MTTHPTSEVLTYADYLRVPELLSLQSPLGPDDAPDEMLFIILQQAQELWFKQILHDLRRVIDSIDDRRLDKATRLLGRLNRVLHVLSEEVEVMETLPPQEFGRFRFVLKSASGFESLQFRELELAVGLDDEAFLKLASRLIDVEAVQLRWPRSLHAAWLDVLRAIDPSPAEAVSRVYAETGPRPIYDLAEALADFDLRFLEWRFHHLQLVVRVIGDRAQGTGGSSGSGYLTRTLQLRFFPELWEARNRLTAGRTV